MYLKSKKQHKSIIFGNILIILQVTQSRGKRMEKDKSYIHLSDQRNSLSNPQLNHVDPNDFKF